MTGLSSNSDTSMPHTKITELVKQKLNRQTLSVHYVGEILRRGKIFSPLAQRREDLRETVSEIWKENPNLSSSEITALVSQKLKFSSDYRKVSEKGVAEIVRSNKIIESILQTARENPNVSLEKLAELVRQKLNRNRVWKENQIFQI